jgi:hypothetical protein
MGASWSKSIVQWSSTAAGLTVLIEQLAELPMLDQLTDAYAAAQDEYMPSGPPLSPLTTSYFCGWGYFDLHAGAGGVPITGTSHPQGQTDRLKSYPPKPEGASGLPRGTTKATPAATQVLILVFFTLRQKIL